MTDESDTSSFIGMDTYDASSESWPDDPLSDEFIRLRNLTLETIVNGTVTLEEYITSLYNANASIQDIRDFACSNALGNMCIDRLCTFYIRQEFCLFETEPILPEEYENTEEEEVEETNNAIKYKK